MSADAGDPRGGVAFGYCLAVGRGCQPDAARGVKILHQLVDAGVPYANMALADLYFNGTGVEADMSKALSALTAAASAGVPQCYTLMAVIAHLGNASRKADPARAKVYLRMAEERGEANARAAFDTLVQQAAGALSRNGKDFECLILNLECIEFGRLCLRNSLSRCPAPRKKRGNERGESLLA
jgi:TPR repeat protein